MRHRVTGVAALLLAATILAPADAGATTLRLTGHGTGYVDVTLPRPTTFEELRGARLKTDGTYVGWWITRIGETVTSDSNQAGGVRFVHADADGSLQPDYDFGFRRAPLDPGRYRVYLASDGNASVEVVAQGLPRSLRLTPAHPTTSAGAIGSLAVLPGGVVRGAMRQGADLAPNSLVASSITVFSDPGVTVEGLSACLARARGSCTGPGKPGGWMGYVMSLYQDFGVTLTAHYLPGEAPVGPHAGIQGTTAGPGVTRVVGSLFQLVTVP